MSWRCFMVEPVCDPVTRVQLFRWDAEHTRGTPVMRRLDTGEQFAEWQPGMMYYEYDQVWSEEHQEFTVGEHVARFVHPGPDGKSLVVILPVNGHQWYVDSIASNCPEKDRPHNCWTRTGTPPDVTVGKGACKCDGAGSIRSPGYHGHLVDGTFSDPLGDS